MKREFSAGIIVFFQNSTGREYLILNYPKGHWDLPKGKMELNETKLETAQRELKEETNLEAEILPGFEETLSYIFRGTQGLIDKEVTFFVGKVKTKTVILSEEHLDFKWLALDEAINLLTFQNARNILSLADKFINK